MHCKGRQIGSRMSQKNVCFEKRTDKLMTRLQPLVFEKVRLVFSQKLDPFHILAIRVHKISDAR